MTTKKDIQFSLEDCSCTEMMAQMMTQFEGQQRMSDACAEMMSRTLAGFWRGSPGHTAR